MNESVQKVHTIGFEEGRNATEIALTIRLFAAAAGCEWRHHLVAYVASLDVRQAFDNETPTTLSPKKEKPNEEMKFMSWTRGWPGTRREKGSTHVEERFLKLKA